LVLTVGPELYHISVTELKPSALTTELYTVLEKGQDSFLDPVQNNQSRLLLKEPSLPINELLEKSSKIESKFNLHPLPSAVWPKHSDLAPIPRHHNKSTKGPKSDRLTEHNSEKSRGDAAGLLPKIQLTGAAGAAANRTAQKTHQDSQAHISPPQQGESEGHPNSRSRAPAHTQPQTQPQQPAASPRKDPPNRRQDPEENRPRKSSLYQSGISTGTWNNSRPPVVFNRRSSSLLFQFDILRRGMGVLFPDLNIITELPTNLPLDLCKHLPFGNIYLKVNKLVWNLKNIRCFTSF